MIYKFRPIYKSTIWGGDAIASFKGVDSQIDGPVGESWEISDVEGSESVVCDTPHEGLTLPTLLSRHGADIMGTEAWNKYGHDFPLLVKFIDACDDLSVQVHPNDSQARAQGRGRNGKTEMWYVVSARPGAYLYAGFKSGVTRDMYLKAVADNSVMNLLQRYEVKAGDAFYIPAGCVHALGAGCLVAEIQQTSDTTYRIYDYDRRDSHGNRRELHTTLAAEVIDFESQGLAEIQYDHTATDTMLVKCDYFTTRLLALTNPHTIDVAAHKSFLIVMNLDGDVELVDGDGVVTRLRRGHTALVTADTSTLRIVPVTTKTPSQLLVSHL